MTLPKSATIAKFNNWLTTPLGGGVLAIMCAGLLAIASNWFVTHEVMAREVEAPLAAEVKINATQGEQLADLTKAAEQIAAEKKVAAERLAAEQAANAERDKVIRSLVESTQALANEVRATSEKTRTHEVQIAALQAVTAGIRTEIAVVQANQITAAKQSDRIEDKIDRLIDGKSRVK